MTSFNIPCNARLYTGKQLPSSAVSTKIYIAILLLSIFIFCGQTFAQLAPVNPPAGGFAIDGGLRANTPTSPSPWASNQGDWYPGSGGTGGSVFDASGAPINSAMSGRAVPDNYNGNDNIFTNGSKFNDYVGDLRWFTNSAPDKNDINNALYHISRDASNNQWAFIAGDRLSTNGTSYIDFEFLQGTISTKSDGTFEAHPLTSKPNGGGRTQGDIIISMEYTNGGTKPNVFIYQWKLSGTTWSYQPATIANLDQNAFAETNRTAAETNLPYSAFGGTTYQQFAFVEAAINITYVIKQLSQGQACAGLSIQTLWIKTKASASSTAALKDFVDPIPVNFQFGTSSIDNPGPFCANDNTAYTLSATPSGGTFTIDRNGTVSSITAFTPSSEGAGTYSINYNFSGCSASTSFVVNPVATVNAGGPNTVCQSATPSAITLSGASVGGGASTGAWSIVSGGGTLSSTTQTASPQTVTYTPAANFSGTATLRLTTNDPAGPCNAENATRTINVNPAATADAGGPYTMCASDASVTLVGTYGGSATGGAWTGAGTFGTPVKDATAKTVTVSYTPTATEKTNHSATVTFTTEGQSAPCTAAAPTATVTINAAPDAPQVTYIPPTCLETTFKVSVDNPVSGSTYTLRQLTGGVSLVTKKAPDDVVAGKIVFAGLTVGKGYRVTETTSAGCISLANACGDFSSLTQSTATIQAKVPTQQITLQQQQTSVVAAPNPFNDKIRFSLQSSVSGQGTLELYNMLGQKVKTVFQGYVEKGQVQTIEYIVPGAQRSNLIYVFKVGGEKTSGKLIGLK